MPIFSLGTPSHIFLKYYPTYRRRVASETATRMPKVDESRGEVASTALYFPWYSGPIQWARGGGGL